MPVRIGSDSLLDELPQEIEINNKDYILSKNVNNDPTLFSTECPHRGGKVQVEDNCLRCPWHDWEFDDETGNVTNNPDEQQLSIHEVVQKDSGLYANIPSLESTIDFTVSSNGSHTPKIELLSHATLSIEYDGFRLVTDPWLDGPAFLDSWTQYPPPTCDIDEVTTDTDAIWITHDHPDHLNIRTLDHFSKETPVYVPELNALRLTNRLDELGFNNIFTLPTETKYNLSEEIEVVYFESASTFNDSILVINCGGFKILNAHDAGINWEVSNAVPSVDMVATEFTGGAGEYPYMWKHLDDEEKKKFARDKNRQKLEEFEVFVDLFEPDYLLPFAKFMERPHPEHKPERKLMIRNQPSDIVENFENDDVKVLDLIPGESWEAKTGTINRRHNRKKFFDEKFKERYLQNSSEYMQITVNNTFNLTHNEIKKYFEAFSGSEIARKIGSFALTLSLTGDNRQINSLIRIHNSNVEYKPTEEPTPLESPDADNHVRMFGSGEKAQFVIRNNRSWDDFFFGWWCELDRHPDEYNKWFRRLMHAPWEACNDVVHVARRYDIETELAGKPIADIIEQSEVQDILSNYGLYCAGCSQGIAEDIIEAARIHGLSHSRTQNLINDIENEVSDPQVAGD